MSSGVARLHRLLGLLVILALPALSASCRQVRPVLKIGLVAPFEGQHRAVGYDVIYSARLAVQEINAAGGIGDYFVTLQALDDGGDPALAREVAASLVLDPAVMVVVGHWLTDTTKSAGPVYAAGGLPLISTGQPPFGAEPVADLTQDFVAAYEAITPFDEVPGPYARSAYEAFQMLFSAAGESLEDGPASRDGIANALRRAGAPGSQGQ
jgi:ABC-type branched-subunit amino acid transport system substrate-binding protein